MIKVGQVYTNKKGHKIQVFCMTDFYATVIKTGADCAKRVNEVPIELMQAVIDEGGIWLVK